MPGETCPTGTVGDLRARVQLRLHEQLTRPPTTDALFFADYSRECIWAMRTGGEPAPGRVTIETFVTARRTRSTSSSAPTATSTTSTSTAGRSGVSTSPPANQPPAAVATATPTSGTAPLPVNFDGSGSSDPDGTIAYAWDLDGDGQFDDSTAPSLRSPIRRRYVLGETPCHGQRRCASDARSDHDHRRQQPADWRSSTRPRLDNLEGGRHDLVLGQRNRSRGGHACPPPRSRGTSRSALHCPANCHCHQVQTFTASRAVRSARPTTSTRRYSSSRLTATDSPRRLRHRDGDAPPETVDRRPDAVARPACNCRQEHERHDAVLPDPVEGSTTTVSAPSPQVLERNDVRVLELVGRWRADPHDRRRTRQPRTRRRTHRSRRRRATAPTVLADSPLAYWRLGEASGTTAADASRQQPHGLVPEHALLRRRPAR